MNRCPILISTTRRATAAGCLATPSPTCGGSSPCTGTSPVTVVRVIGRSRDRRKIDEVSKNPQLFSSAERTCMLKDPSPEEVEMMRALMINMDPPKHLKYRRLVRSAFTPRKVDSYEPRFREIAREILDRALPSGRCDFVEDIAMELPLIAICELMGVPLEKRQRLFELTNIMLGMDDPDLTTSEEDGMNAMIEMFMLGMELATAHRENGSEGYRGYAAGRHSEDEPLTDEEFCNFFMLLIVAGNETTRTVTSQGMRMLLENPDQYQALVDNPALVSDAIEEFLRYNPAVIAFGARRWKTRCSAVNRFAKAIWCSCSTALPAPTKRCSMTRSALTSCATSAKTFAMVTAPSASASISALARTWRGWNSPLSSRRLCGACAIRDLTVTSSGCARALITASSTCPLCLMWPERSFSGR